MSGIDKKTIIQNRKPIKKKERKFSLLDLFIHIILGCFALLCILPMWALLSASFSSEKETIQTGFRLIPKQIELTGWKYVLEDISTIIGAYRVTFFVSIIGTTFSLLIVSGIAYTISRRDFKYKNRLSFYVFFTMLFNGGLVPWYILINNYLHLGDNILALILPYLTNAWFILLLRTFFQKIPFEIIESCYIDGANEFSIFFRFILPLSKPGLATIGLFTMLQYWNDWWLGLLFINNNKLYPLQLMLYKMMGNIRYLSSGSHAIIGLQNIPQQSAQMAIAILAAGPMLLVFPFFQKYFIRGITVGAIKG